MWICEACGRVFDAPDAEIVKGRFGEGFYREPDSVVLSCPLCHGAEPSPAARCAACGGWHAAREFLELCPACEARGMAMAAQIERVLSELRVELIAERAGENAAMLRFLELTA